MDLRDKGYTLYKKGLKYKEIAEKLDVSVNTVKSWASRYWKAEQVATKSCNRKKKVATEKVATKKQAGPGAPKGNVNAVGNHGGAPPGNTNALKHGGWSAVMFGSWSEENRAAIEQCDKSVDVSPDSVIQSRSVLRNRQYISIFQDYSFRTGIMTHISTHVSRIYHVRFFQKGSSVLPNLKVRTYCIVNVASMLVFLVEHYIIPVLHPLDPCITRVRDMKILFIQLYIASFILFKGGSS